MCANFSRGGASSRLIDISIGLIRHTLTIERSRCQYLNDASFATQNNNLCRIRDSVCSVYIIRLHAVLRTHTHTHTPARAHAGWMDGRSSRSVDLMMFDGVYYILLFSYWSTATCSIFKKSKHVMRSV